MKTWFTSKTRSEDTGSERRQLLSELQNVQADNPRDSKPTSTGGRQLTRSSRSYGNRHNDSAFMASQLN